LLVFDGSGGYLYTAQVLKTSLGVQGAIEGDQYDAIDLQYIGGGAFIVRGNASASGGFVVR
jgi:hypothetical protein